MYEKQQKDLVVLVADQDIEFCLKGLLSRHKSLNPRKLSTQYYDVYRHPGKDPGCLHKIAP